MGWDTKKYRARSRGLLSLVMIAALVMINCGSGSDSSSAGSTEVCDCQGVECFVAILFLPILPLLCDSGTSSATALDLSTGNELIRVDSPSVLEDYFLAYEGDTIEMEGVVKDPSPGTFSVDLYQGPTVIISNLTSGRNWLAEVDYSSFQADSNSYHWRASLSLNTDTVVPGLNRIVLEVDYGGGIYAATELELNISLGSII